MLNPDELKKLAELCGLEIALKEQCADDNGVIEKINAYLRNNDFYCWMSDWRPDASIEQASLLDAAMFERGFALELHHLGNGFYRARYIEIANTGFQKIHQGFSKNEAESRSIAALAALKEET